MKTNEDQQNIYKQLLEDATKIYRETGANVSLTYSTNDGTARNVQVYISVPDGKSQ